MSDPSNPYRTPQSAATPSDGGGLAIAGFILGLLAMLAWCIPLIGLPVTVAGLVLSVKGRRSGQASLAIAGMVLNGIALGLTLGNAALGAYLAVSGKHAVVNQFMK